MGEYRNKSGVACRQCTFELVQNIFTISKKLCRISKEYQSVEDEVSVGS